MHTLGFVVSNGNVEWLVLIRNACTFNLNVRIFLNDHWDKKKLFKVAIHPNLFNIIASNITSSILSPNCRECTYPVQILLGAH